MTPRRRLARGAALASGVVIVLSGVVLTADYASARVRAGRDTARLEALQIDARNDPEAARLLEAEHDRITRAKLARNARTSVLSAVLLVASTMFIGAAKWQVAQGPRRPPPPPQLIKVRVAPRAAPPPVASSAAPTAVAPAPEIDLEFVDRLIAREGTHRESAIAILQAIQAHYRYLPDAALARVCELTEVTPAQIAGTSSFYARFRRSPVGEHVIRVCHGTACHVSGARQLTDELRRQLRIPDGADTDTGGHFTVDEVACVGCCSLAPVVMVDEHTTGRLTPDTVCTALHVVAQPAGGR
ncbi:MAG: NAD(P)H-dependent oxidoreductase subunit E [Vicinamibacterales bacterium]